MIKQNDQLPMNQAKIAVSANSEGYDDNSFLTEEETKKILTPFAFNIDETLLGIPLAVPWRRGLALFIDFILIAILSGAPGELLAIVVAITFYKIGSKKSRKTGKSKGLKRAAFRLIGAFIIFVVLVDTLPSLFDDTVSDKNVATDMSSIGWADGIALGALSTGAYQQITNSSCKDNACWQSELAPFVEQLPELSQNDKTAKTIIETLVATIDEKHKLSRTSEKELEQYFLNQYLALKVNINAEDLLKEASAPESKAQVILGEETKLKDDKDSAVYKGVEWMKGLIEDLGLGFGWAAFYFTVLTSIWHGQTPGKKLFKIRVIQLDGTRLSMWDSFGRYGGYGAGVATGLLGFLQIYWDPNRQAIHDKISATIVIDVTKFEQLKKG
ncbi:MAG: RDD family protein [Colwellia sp.]|nr:RDD family protein [Colwellia sp.]